MAQDKQSHLSRRTLLKLTAGSAAAAAGGPALTRLAAAAQTEQPIRGGTLTYGYQKPAANIINPLDTVGTGQNVLIEPMFLRLVYGRKWTTGLTPPTSGPLELAVAETMTEIEKDQAWEFTLRKNVKWHDGQPVTADDLIFGIWLSLNKNANMSNETPPYAIKGSEQLQQQGAAPDNIAVAGATKLGDYAVRIELEKPIPNYWKSWYVGYWPMPRHIFGSKPFAQLVAPPYTTMPVGNGPFKASKFVDGQYMEMVANDDFYLGRPYLDKYIVRFGDPDTLSAAVQAQAIDGTSIGAGPVYDRLTKLPYLAGNPVPTPHPWGFVANVARLGAQQAAVLNHAIMYAIDVPTMGKEIYSNTLSPSNYLFQQVPGFEQPPAGFETASYDPEKAKSILKAGKWDSSKELQWLVIGPPGSAQAAMQAMLTQVGINTKYHVVDPATAIDELYRKSDFDIVFSNFGPYEFFELDWKYFKCGWSYDQGGFNYANYCNKQVDALFTQGLAETDDAKRKSLFDQAILLLNQTPPQATLYRNASTYIWNKRVRGAYPYNYRLPVRPPFERVWLAPK